MSCSCCEPIKTQLLIIGAGPGGYTAAFLAADLGMDVTLINTDPTPGGTCLHRGCIPSKALLHAAKIIDDAKDANEFGIQFNAPKINLDQLRDWKNKVVNQLSSGLEQLCQKRNIRYIYGRGQIIDANTAIAECADKTEHILFEKAIIATGSTPVNLPFIPPTDKVLFSTSALDIEDIPERLLVIGGGYIGLELSCAYAALGSNVSVVEMTKNLLPGIDADLTRVVERQFKTKFENLFLSTKVLAVEDKGEKISVSMEDKKGETFKEEFNKILVSVGRRPNTDGIGLVNTAVKINDKGFIQTNDQCQTDQSNIYAIGDITGNPMLAHKASAEARIAVHSILGNAKTFNPSSIPSVVFTDPEIATCGLSENEAEEKGIKIETVKFPWMALGRALTLNRPEGFTKLVIDPNTRKILGIGIVGAGAGELIAEGALAIEKGVTVDELAHVIHPHPTLSETFLEAAELFLGENVHIYKPKKKA